MGTRVSTRRGRKGCWKKLMSVAIITALMIVGCDYKKAPKQPTGTIVKRKDVGPTPGPARDQGHSFVWVRHEPGAPLVRYRALRRKGASKRVAAAISNEGRTRSGRSRMARKAARTRRRRGR